MKPRLLFYCQHVLGMGHMVRSREILKGLGSFEVWFVNGGEPVEGFGFPDGVQVVQLPPVGADPEFRNIDATDQTKQQRRAALLQLLGATDPDLLMIEMFPFGRRKFAFELVPLLEEIGRRGRRTRVVSSVRDILVAKRDQARHDEQACRLLNEHFDLVLVHADPRLQQLSETFTRFADLRCPVTYTGFVTQPGDRKTVPGDNSNGLRIIASAGGGRVGFPLLDAVIQASHLLSRSAGHRLSVFTGPYLDDADYVRLARRAAGAPWITIERYAPDFVGRLNGASLLVSMAGYNTCMNILTSRVPVLVLPFTGNQNDEQTIRARKLEALGCLGVLGPDLDPVALAERMERKLRGPARNAAVQLDLNGVANTATLLETVAQGCAAHV